MTLRQSSVPQWRMNKWSTDFLRLLTAIAGAGFVAGGYARYLLVDGAPKPEDIDVFLKDRNYFDAIKADLERIGYSVQQESIAAITYDLSISDGVPVQLVKPLNHEVFRGRTGTVEEVLSTFDFTVNQFALEVVNGSTEVLSYVGAGSYDDQTSKRLIIVHNSSPMALIYRMMKYAGKGYWMPRSEAAKLFIGWDNQSDQMKKWVYDSLTGDEKFDIDLLYALTDGIIGEKELFGDG